MPKKKLNTDAITNELQNSAFFSSQHSPIGGGQTENVDQTEQPVQRSVKSEAKNAQTERNIRTVEPNDRTDNKIQHSSLLDEITDGVKTDKRPTERYSFEIYSDQIPQIEELQYLYKKKTSQKLPASRILREALGVYLKNAFEAMKKKK